jgi:hypothetical protein
MSICNIKGSIKYADCGLDIEGVALNKENEFTRKSYMQTPKKGI